jgi:filamentous hemagglutinin family protein
MNNKSANRQMHKQSQHRLKPGYAAVLLAFAVQTAQANPIGGSVVNGQANFSTTGNTLTVTNTPGTIINWQGFSINTNETTRFAQQSASSAVLNRVVGSDPSSILGTLQSNGRVFLINPNGILFGAGAVVDVAGLVASTLNFSDADFLAGNSHFTAVPGAANVSNAGNIIAHGDGQSGGQIFLIAPNVENTGVITAPNGEILLAAGYSVDLVNTNNPNLRVSITAPAGDAANVGQLIASSGSLGLFGTVVRNSGVVSADSATMQGGKIVFKASQRTEISGTVSASGTTGGNIQVLGNQVGIMDGATVTANGTQGGGAILVGGDYQGKNPGVPNAQVTYVAPTANIHADATGNGNGGKVIVWADDTTRFYGNISARGGINGGNGGFVETSGHNYLDFRGLVDTRAPHGLVGTLLLDPSNITINAGPDVLAGGTFSLARFQAWRAPPPFHGPPSTPSWDLARCRYKPALAPSVSVISTSMPAGR